MKTFFISSLILLSACGETVTKIEKIEVKVPVPVLCTVEIERKDLSIDLLNGIPSLLEEQNAILKESLAQSKSYNKELEANIIGCGGKIIDKK